MTNREYITATTQRFNFSDTDIELFFENQKTNLDPDEECDVTAAKKALITEIASILPLYNVSEGGYSISWNFDAIKMWYRLACEELGIVPTGIIPTVKAVKVW